MTRCNTFISYAARYDEQLADAYVKSNKDVHFIEFCYQCYEKYLENNLDMDIE